MCVPMVLLWLRENGGRSVYLILLRYKCNDGYFQLDIGFLWRF